MDNPILSVTMRYLHIVAALFVVGGMSFVVMCVTPAVKLLEDSTRQSLTEMINKRFMKILWAAIATLIITGAYNWIVLNSDYSAIRPWGQALIGSKVLIAAIMFVVIWMQSMKIVGTTPKGERRVLMINIHLAAAVILLASTLRFLRMSQGA